MVDRLHHNLQNIHVAMAKLQDWRVNIFFHFISRYNCKPNSSDECDSEGKMRWVRALSCPYQGSQMRDTPLHKHPPPQYLPPAPPTRGFILQTCLAPAMGTVPSVPYDKYRENWDSVFSFCLLGFTFIICIITHTIIIITFPLPLSLSLYLTSSWLLFYQRNRVFMTILSHFLQSFYTLA